MLDLARTVLLKVIWEVFAKYRASRTLRVLAPGREVMAGEAGHAQVSFLLTYLHPEKYICLRPEEHEHGRTRATNDFSPF